jgi:hypothetical protein
MFNRKAINVLALLGIKSSVGGVGMVVFNRLRTRAAVTNDAATPPSRTDGGAMCVCVCVCVCEVSVG